MPEGDSLRRLAGRVSERFLGQRVERSVFRHPRLALADLAGRVLVDVDAVGKHLLCRFDDGRTLHLHLLMQGRVRFGPQLEIPEWRRRFELRFETGTMTGIDIPLLHLLETSKEQLFVGHLGPDVCGPFDPEAAVARLSSALSSPLGGALLDQRLIAGFGNIYAVETPFICGLNPFVTIGDLDDVTAIVAVGAALIRTNASRGPQNTTGRRLDLSDHWVLSSRVRTCKVCGTRIARRTGKETPWRRRTAWCPRCQSVDHVTVDIERAMGLLALHPARRLLDRSTGELMADVSERVVLGQPGRR